jgi:hypothetical protein
MKIRASVLFATLFLLAAMRPSVTSEASAVSGSVDACSLPVAGNCELYEFLEFPTWAIQCAGGGNCIDIQVTGIIPGSNGTCPPGTCTSSAYGLTITNNGCCCGGVVTVDVFGQNPINLGAGASTSMTIGPLRPGCGGSDIAVLKIGCPGTALLEARLHCVCDTCDSKDE